MRSLKTRLMLGTSLATAVILIVAALSLYLLLRTALLREFDDTLLARAHAIASMTEFKQGQARIETEAANEPAFRPSRHPDYYQLVDARGASMARSASLQERDLPGKPTAAVSKPVVLSIRLPDGRHGRVMWMPFTPRWEDEEESPKPPGASSPVMIGVARGTTTLDESLERAQWVLAAVWTCATIILVAVIALIIRRAMRPVQSLASRIETIGTSNLSDRLALAEAPSELTAIVTRLNDMLARLQRAFEQEKSFTADAAHELRTPLAGLTAALEVCTAQPRKPQEYQTTMLGCLEAVRRMQRMVENLLCLARADARQIPLDIGPCDLSELVRSAWSPSEPTATARSLSVRIDTPADLTLPTDRDRLTQVLRNLFDNAVRYANIGGSVNIAASRTVDQIRIQVINSGSGVSEAQTPFVFERFWRGDSARAADGASCGLGLSVCRKLVEVLGGTIEIRSSVGGDFEVLIALPAARGEPRRAG